MDFKRENWIYNWNSVSTEEGLVPKTPIQLNDETLRDGLQSPSARMPSVEAKIDLLHILTGLGVSSLDIGFPASSENAFSDTERLAREIADARLPLNVNCAARTLASDIRPIIEISQNVGIPIEAAAFLGSSPARMYAEEWDEAFLLKSVETSIKEAVGAGLSIMFVTEDTTRTPPELLRRLYTTAIECGARRICAADTVGFATPTGAMRLISFLKKVVKATGEDVAIDWHGHMDRGLGLGCTLAALEGGADRLHGSALGIGERVGNTPLDLVIVNLKLMGLWERDIGLLNRYVAWVPENTGIPIPRNYPVFGRDGFRTATGVHAAAIAKAIKKGDGQLVDLIYSSIPASWCGKSQTIEIGPMSGDANSVSWLLAHGKSVTMEKVNLLRTMAKKANSVLTEEQIVQALDDMEGS